jgi:Glycosyl hydrolases family 2, TIM barrel domain
MAMGFKKIFSLFLLAYLLCFCQGRVLAESSSEYASKAQILKSQKEWQQVYQLCDECIAQFSEEADHIASKLKSFPSDHETDNYKVMNDVAFCYFTKGEAMRDEAEGLTKEDDDQKKQELKEEAKKILWTNIEKYPYAKLFDAHGWYYKIAHISRKVIAEIDGELWESPHEVYEEKKVVLYDPGEEFPVDYTRYGKFSGIGTKEYNYAVNDPIGLSKAVGEGIHPNTTSVKFDPEYSKIKKLLTNINHWKIKEKRDFNTAFYKWLQAPESPGLKLFQIAEILERSGYDQHAIKAFYAILVHYPQSYGWTYWHTPWYIGKVAKYRLQRLLEKNPDLGITFEDADVHIVNGYDNNIRNDEYIINPGKLYRPSFWKKKLKKLEQQCQKRGKAIETKGSEEAKLVKYDNGDWQFLVNGKPTMIRAITYGPSKVGESPHKGTLSNWTTQDTNNNGIIDAPYESWVDKNGNNIQDTDEKTVGDFQLMKEMGVNALRLYHHPVELNKEILRQMYDKYGIYVLMGDFLGKYAIGSGADWETGTDYDSEKDKENMLKSLENMVLEYKDEPYVLMWLIGNENVYGLGCNADKKPESFFKFANIAAKYIKSIDPKKRPVAIVSGDILYLDIFAKNCPDIDIFGTNAYRGKDGFLDIWDEVKRTAHKPAMITEYGVSAYAQGYTYEEAEEYQAEYHKNAWLNIKDNSCGSGAGNAIGGILFEWVDEWWKAYAEGHHNREGLFSGPFLDGYMHEEWLGVTGQGDGKKSPFLRKLRKSYYTYKSLWN